MEKVRYKAMRSGIGEMLVVLLIIAVILLITGGKKIPELAKSLKKGKDILTEKDDDKKASGDSDAEEKTA